MWHSATSDAVLHVLNTDAVRGLRNADARGRLVRLGRNVLVPAAEVRWWHAVLQALAHPVMALLLGTGVVYAVLDARGAALAIVGGIAMEVAVQAIVAARAKRAVAWLIDTTARDAIVIREGAVGPIPAVALVPGDLVLLQARRRVPADLRLLESTALRIDESSLTGKSAPVAKTADALLPPETPLSDRTNLALASTLVTLGEGTGIVIATGPRTEAGRIAASMRIAGEPRTPFRRYIAQCTHSLVWLVVGLGVLVPPMDALLAHRPWHGVVLDRLMVVITALIPR